MSKLAHSNDETMHKIELDRRREDGEQDPAVKRLEDLRSDAARLATDGIISKETFLLILEEVNRKLRASIAAKEG